MTDRAVMGEIGGGVYGLRSSLPGYNVLAEPLGSPHINFDTRYNEIGTVVAAGLIQCGGGPILFPAMPYVPICSIALWDGSFLQNEQVIFNTQTHCWLPAVAIVTTNSLQVVAFTNPFVPTTATFDPNGSYYLYSVFASG